MTIGESFIVTKIAKMIDKVENAVFINPRLYPE